MKNCVDTLFHVSVISSISILTKELLIMAPQYAYPTGVNMFKMAKKMNNINDNTTKPLGVSCDLNYQGMTNEVTQYRKLKIQIAKQREASLNTTNMSFHLTQVKNSSSLLGSVCISPVRTLQT